MASEIHVKHTADKNVYAVIRNAAGAVYRTTTQTFVTFVDADVASYAIPLTEQGTSSGYYVGDFPSAVTTRGTYVLVAHERAGATPAVSDTAVAEGPIDWDGSAEAAPAFGDDLISLAYYKTQNNIAVSTYDDLLTNAIHAASAAMINYAKNDFKAQSYADYYDVAQPSTLLVLDHRPVNEVTQVTLLPYDEVPEVVAGSEFVASKAGILAFKPSSASGCFYFPQGFQSVKVEYSAGYASVPEDVQAVCAQLVAKLQHMAGRDLNVASQKTANYQVVFKTYATADTFLSPDIKAVLDRHRRLV